uniref:ATPTB12 n=1 Tax=Euglena gracilis TaxID=3039 RepID=UPI0012B67D76|nr:Chain E, ATPTB12 [Euglena gracilis]6TDU_e Chain e, ATPTB12 [Euglena gracilis]6TDV_E Chain E, ATPTB12 [Euglena gracilis]6TDV_e Chain e, ATPTB12 [Euglena gracilis]
MSSYTGAALAPKSERLRLAFEEKQKDHQKCIEEAKGKGLKKDELIDACAWTHRKTILALKDWFAYRPPFQDRRSKWAEYCSIRHDSGSWLGWSQKFF